MENQSKSKIQIKINGTDISEFSAVTEGSGLLALKESVENRVFELTGKTLSKNSERKIIISEEFSNELDAAQIKVQIGNDVIISAKGGRIKDAAGFFCQNVLCEKNASQLRFKLGHMLDKRRPRYMRLLGCSRIVESPGQNQELFQMTHIHNAPLPFEQHRCTPQRTTWRRNRHPSRIPG